MRCRVVSPFNDGKSLIGYIWLDCNFPISPEPNKLLRYWPYEKTAMITTVVPAIPGFVHSSIDIVVFTTAITAELTTMPLDEAAEIQRQLLKQKWTWVREPKVGTRSYELDDDREKHNAWLLSNNLPPVTSMALSLINSRNASVGLCFAEKSTNGWDIKA